MKKAKEYYLELKPVLNSGPDGEIQKKISSIVIDLVSEMKDIMDMRKARSNAAMIAIIEEQNRKWNAIVYRSRIDGLNIKYLDLFKDYINQELGLS